MLGGVFVKGRYWRWSFHLAAILNVPILLTPSDKVSTNEGRQGYVWRMLGKEDD